MFFFKRNFCSGRKETRMITKLVILKAHQITVKCRVKVVLKCSSSISGYFMVLDTLSCDGFIHSIRNVRCFHSYSTNINKIVSNTILLKMQWVTLLSETFYSLRFRPAPHYSRHLQTRIQTSDNHGREDNSKHPCWSTVLQAGNRAMPRASLTFLGGISWPLELDFALISVLHMIILPTMTFHLTLPSHCPPHTPAHKGPEDATRGGMLQKLPSVSKRLNRISGWSCRLLRNRESNRD